MIQILFDTNVLLDAVLAREFFVADAAFLLEAVEAALIRIDYKVSEKSMTKARVHKSLCERKEPQ